MTRHRAIFLLLVAACGSDSAPATGWRVFETTRDEPFRPQVHYTARQNWLNDPNGLVWHQGEWHLFYQRQPDLPIWGPMHWGHAVSLDRLNWEELPDALDPDPVLGMAFSGTAISDSDGHTGLCPTAAPCLLAWFTHSGGADGQQKQSLAVSTDRGRSFELYPDNPVLPNPGIPDFRDPRVWEDAAGFHMAVAAGDRVAFYRSDNGTDWTPTGEFVPVAGPVGTLECPDLFPLVDDLGVKRWVLLVSVLGDGPQGGSGVAWFVGDFDGQSFSGFWRGWVDQGPDFYAAQAWSPVAEAPVVAAWASNWDYALLPPTDPWRGVMALPRSLSLTGAGAGVQLVQRPLSLAPLADPEVDVLTDVVLDGELVLTGGSPVVLDLIVDPRGERFELSLLEGPSGAVVIGWEDGTLYLDRTATGGPMPAAMLGRYETVLRPSEPFDLTVIVDGSLVEVFALGGQVAMTAQVFPDPDARGIRLSSTGPIPLAQVKRTPLFSIWAP